MQFDDQGWIAYNTSVLERSQHGRLAPHGKFLHHTAHQILVSPTIYQAGFSLSAIKDVQALFLP